jgi:hypothetical protein
LWYASRALNKQLRKHVIYEFIKNELQAPINEQHITNYINKYLPNAFCRFLLNEDHINNEYKYLATINNFNVNTNLYNFENI